MVERAAVNRDVVGSSPTSGAIQKTTPKTLRLRQGYLSRKNWLLLDRESVT